MNQPEILLFSFFKFYPQILLVILVNFWIYKQLVLVYFPANLKYFLSIFKQETLGFIIVWQKWACLEYAVETIVQKLVFVESDNQPCQSSFFFWYIFLSLLFRVNIIDIWNTLVFLREIFGYQIPVVITHVWIWTLVTRIALCLTSTNILRFYESVLKEMIKNVYQVFGEFVDFFLFSFLHEKILAGICYQKVAFTLQKGAVEYFTVGHLFFFDYFIYFLTQTQTLVTQNLWLLSVTNFKSFKLTNVRQFAQVSFDDFLNVRANEISCLLHVFWKIKHFFKILLSKS